MQFQQVCWVLCLPSRYWNKVTRGPASGRSYSGPWIWRSLLSTGGEGDDSGWYVPLEYFRWPLKRSLWNIRIEYQDDRVSSHQRGILNQGGMARTIPSSDRKSQISWRVMEDVLWSWEWCATPWYIIILCYRCFADAEHANYSSVNLNTLKTSGRRTNSVSDLVRSRLRGRLSDWFPVILSQL